VATSVHRLLDLGDKELLLVLHGMQPPTETEWNEVLSVIRGVLQRHGKLTRLRMLSITDGGSPDANMRNALAKALDGKSLHMAMVTDSAVARGVVTAISWFNPWVKSFSPRHFQPLIDHLELAAKDHPAIADALSALDKQLRVATAAQLLSAWQRANPQPAP
jgi:hypothetical protein